MEDELEKFEITDYDLENEFAIPTKRKGLTKEQQIYGIWSETNEGEETEEVSVPLYSQPKLLKKGLNFVAGGVQQAGKEKKEASEAEQEEDEEKDQYFPKPMFGTRHVDSSDEEDHLPLDFGNRKKATPPQSAGRNELREIAGFRVSGKNTHFREGGIGDWEKHTTGIGSKLMKMMGYEEGKGLGKNLQGIATPVEAQKRKGKGAIGFYGTERGERSLKDFPVEDSDEEEKTKFEEQLQQWKKTGVKKKIKYNYKTTEEVIQEGRTKKIKPKSDSHITGTKVIDMTGPETRVLSSYHAIAGQKKIVEDFEETKRKVYEHFDVPELLHNLQLLLEKSEEDIINNAKTLEREENKIVHLNHEREKYETLIEREELEFKHLDQATLLAEMLETKHNNKALTLSDAANIFREFKTEYPKIYLNYEIAFLAPTYIIPLLKELFSTWNPLANPGQHLELISEWGELLEWNGGPKFGDVTVGVDQPTDPYHQLLWETWASALRSTIMGPWEPRDCGPLITVFETWKPPIIPVSIHSSILHCVVLPRITRAVHNWNPMQDTVPIHTWLHPWLPLLSDNLQAVYPVIRQKLSAALVHWHPSDRSAKMVLQPWKGVFSEVSMATLIQSSIQPKLETALLEMPITPHSQKLEPWHWFLDWEDLLPSQITIGILERCFFPKWYQALGTWLSTNPPYPEVIAWYKGWQDLIPSKVVNNMQIRQKFQQSLEICQRALTFQPGASEQFGYLLSGYDKLVEPPPPPPPTSSSSSPPRQKKDWADIISSGRRDNLSMRELVEKRSQERGIVFHPLPERNHEGRPVYRCGKLNISFNKNVIFIQTERGWMPKSLTTLLDDA